MPSSRLSAAAGAADRPTAGLWNQPARSCTPQQRAAASGHPAWLPSPCTALGSHLCTLSTIRNRQEEWASVEDEAAAAKQLAEALQRELPPAPAQAAAAGAAAAGGAASPRAVGVVDDSSTSGAPAAALQLVAMPSAADGAAADADARAE